MGDTSEAPSGHGARWLAIAAAALLLLALAGGAILWRHSVTEERQAARRAPCPVQCQRFPTVPAEACERTCERIRAKRPTLDFATNYGQCAFDCLMQLAAVFEVSDAGADDAKGGDAAASNPRVEMERRLVAACADACIEMRARPRPPSPRPPASSGRHDGG